MLQRALCCERIVVTTQYPYQFYFDDINITLFPVICRYDSMFGANVSKSKACYSISKMTLDGAFNPTSNLSQGEYVITTTVRQCLKEEFSYYIA